MKKALWILLMALLLSLCACGMCEHEWSEATCTAPKTCVLCAATEGEALAHGYKDATCETPKTCTVCGETDGEAPGHTYADAICTAPKTCTVCEQTQGDAIGYHVCDDTGTCKACGASFDTEKMTLEELVIDSFADMSRAGIFSSTQTEYKIYRSITLSDIGMPIVELSGDISTVSKENELIVGFSYEDSAQAFTCNAEIKVQGASSANYPKKNFTVKLLKENGKKHKVELVDGWGEENKYCMKANYADFSQARNVVSAKIWGDVVKSRNLDDELSALANGGAIDGYPIAVYNNGQFLGLYTMNIPKDKWMLGMEDSDEKTQAILMGDSWHESVKLHEPMNEDFQSSGWELEYASNEDSEVDNDTTWVVTSFNKLINFVLNNDGEDFKNGISAYADVDKCIDAMLYTHVICGGDNLAKNILWVTYDGTHWYSTVYDMDSTWGMYWNGSFIYTPETMNMTEMTSQNSNINLLWEKIFENFYDRVVERYFELRQGALSMENIRMRFDAFFALIPDLVYEAEKARWTEVPSQEINNKAQILDFAQKHLEKLDQRLQEQQ